MDIVAEFDTVGFQPFEFRANVTDGNEGRSFFSRMFFVDLFLHRDERSVHLPRQNRLVAPHWRERWQQ